MSDLYRGTLRFSLSAVSAILELSSSCSVLVSIGIFVSSFLSIWCGFGIRGLSHFFGAFFDFERLL